MCVCVGGGGIVGWLSLSSGAVLHRVLARCCAPSCHVCPRRCAQRGAAIVIQTAWRLMRVRAGLKARRAKLARNHAAAAGRVLGSDIYNWRNAHKPRKLFMVLGMAPVRAARRPKQLLRAPLRRRVRRHGDARLAREMAAVAIQAFVRRRKLRKRALMIGPTMIGSRVR